MSCISLTLTKPLCTGEIFFCSRGANQKFRSLEIILLEKLRKLMGLKSLSSDGFSTFGIGTIVVLVQELGMSNLAKKLKNNINKIKFNNVPAMFVKKAIETIMAYRAGVVHGVYHRVNHLH